MKTIMFTGHRDCETDAVFLDNIANLYDGLLWIHGGAAGFDTQVQKVAEQFDIATEVHRPNYDAYPSRAAPIIRNREMLRVSDVIVACYDGRKSGGTYFVITEAKKAGKKIIFVPAHHRKSK